MNKTLALMAALAMAGCSNESDPVHAPTEEPAERSSAVAIEVAGGNPAAELASRQITDEYMREIIVEISDDRYEGRGPGSRGDEMARAYLAQRMAELDLVPGAADGSWEQPFDLVGVNAIQPDEWTFAGHGQSMTLKQWDQFIVGSGVQNRRAASRRRSTTGTTTRESTWPAKSCS